MIPVAILVAAALQAPGPPPQIYRAFGASPFWATRIGGGRMVFETPGRDILNVEAPPRAETELGFAYSSREFSLSVEHGECTDRLTRRLYADRVTVSVGAARFEGCGGRALTAPPLPDYGAAGSEPFWWLEIADGRLTFQMHDRVIIAAAPRPAVTGDGRARVYRTPKIILSIRRADCEMDDDQAYADTVTVIAAGRTVHGCGGPVVRAATE
ncbi:MAG TPA: hypothetical protein VMG08_08600 [Allosphingosinicella sp.]|nr:hypothetical protein [Allosphingosinicella sp.]